MNHPINITVINSANGIPQESDGVMMIFAKGIAVQGTLMLDTPYLLTSLADLTALGITAAYDAANSTAVYQQVNEFYAEAGTGARLWLVVTAIAANPYATYVGTETFAACIRYTAQADPANRAKMIGLCYEVPAAGQTAADFPVDVTNTLTALQAAQASLFNQGYQFSCILDGYNMSSTVAPSALQTMATKAAPSVSLCITGTQTNRVSAVGLALGRFSRTTVGHGFGAVEDGPRNASTAYLTNGSTPVLSLKPADVNSLGSKQFLFLRTWFNHSGFYWNDGATCDDPTHFLSTQENNRVANALSADALAFVIDEMGKNLPVDVKSGALDNSYIATIQKEFYDDYIAPLITSGDLSGASIVFAGPNFNATKTLTFAFKEVSTPILGSVTGTIQSVSTL